MSDRNERSGAHRIPKNARRVLDILQDAGKPLTAYEVLDRLRPLGVTGPPTVYRALDRLVKSGLVHRLETLNAFVSCDREGDHAPSAMAICTDCRDVVEMQNDAVPEHLYSWADAKDFSVTSLTIEILGQCGRCKAGRDAAAKGG